MRLNRGAQSLLLSMLAILSCYGFGGCSGGMADEAASSASKQSPSKPQPKLASLTRQQEPASRKRAVVRKASLAVRIPDAEKAERQVNDLVSKLGGFVVESRSSNLDETSPEVAMTLRVPVDRFDDAIASLESLGYRLEKSVSGEDVTAQLVDYDARLKVMQAQESAFRNMLAKTGESTVATNLMEKIMNLRADIESMAAQKSALADLAALSTIELKLVGQAKGFGLTADKTWAQESWNTSTSAFGSVLRYFGSVAIFAAVFSPFWAPFAFLFVKAVRKKPHGNSGSPSPPTYQL